MVIEKCRLCEEETFERVETWENEYKLSYSRGACMNEDCPGYTESYDGANMFITVAGRDYSILFLDTADKRFATNREIFNAILSAKKDIRRNPNG